MLQIYLQYHSNSGDDILVDFFDRMTIDIEVRASEGMCPQINVRITPDCKQFHKHNRISQYFITQQFGGTVVVVPLAPFQIAMPCCW